MLAFITLFLGLVAGTQTVELSVGEGVAAVELLVDGRRAARLDGPPWTAEVDLGAELAPHRLTAIAFDAGDREVARAEQWINLPRPRSQVELLPRGVDGEPPRTVRVLWRSVDGARPDAVRITFDGSPIEAADLEAVELPAYDPQRLHLLKAELRFGYSLAHAEVLIGGTAGEIVGSELTAFPVALPERREPPTEQEMDGWFRRAGRPLRAVALDRGAADLIVVQDQSPRVLGQLERLRRQVLAAPGSARETRPGPTGIRHGDRLRVIVPFALPVARPAAAAPPGDDATPRELFPISADLALPSRAPTSIGVGRRQVAAPRASGLLAALFYRAPPAGVPQRLADAVAEAGRAAAAGGRARAVILVTGPESTDASRFSPDQVRAYLRRLQVPLVVWSPEAPAGWSRWGERVERIRGRNQLLRALHGVRSALDRQLVVWLEGRHLPQAIDWDAAAAGRLRPVVEPPPAVGAAPEPPLAGGEAARATATRAERPADPPTSIAEGRGAAFAEAVEVELVEVDVVVTDRGGRPVTDLDPGDFELFEDGERVEITHFSAPASALPGPGSSPAEPAGPVSGQQDSFHLIVVVDSRLPRAARGPVGDALRGLLAARRPALRITLVSLAETLTVHRQREGESADAAAALAEIERRIGRRPSPPVRVIDELSRVAQEFAAARAIGDPLRREAALTSARASRDAVLLDVRYAGETRSRELRAGLASLERLVRSFAAVAGRKAVLYVGDRLTTAPGGELYAAVEAVAQGADLELRSADLSRLSSEAAALRAERAFDEVVREANLAGVILYTLAPPLAGHAGDAQTASAGPPGSLSALRGERSAGLREALCLMSQGTGGLCSVEASDVPRLVGEAAADFETAYSLGYVPRSPADGEYHEIEVAVRRPGLRVRHRQGYLARPRDDRPRELIDACLLLGAESDALAMELELGPAEPLPDRPGEASLQLEVRVPTARLAALPGDEPGTLEGRLRLLLALADDAGGSTPVQEFPLTFRAPAGASGEMPRYWVHRLRLTIEDAARRVAVGVWDEIGRAGSFLSAPIPTEAPAAPSP